MIYEAGKKISFKDYNADQIEKGEYEECEFLGINFSGHDLSDYRFSGCDFKDCDFSNAKILRTALREIVFKNCKLIGINFEDAHPFNLSFRFEDCILNHSSFYKLDIRKTVFKNCSLNEADFTETDLSNSVFQGCDLTSAVFDRTILESSDFRNASNFSINPNHNQLKKAKFSRNNLSGLLSGFQITIE